MNNITDFIAGLMIQVGNYYKIQKLRRGWIISIITTIYWFIRAFSLGLNSQCFWHIVSISMAIYGWYKWRN